MNRLAAVAVAAVLALAAAGASTAEAAWLRAAPLVLPSAETPNLPGTLRLPLDWTSRAAIVRTLSPDELRALWQRAGAAYGVPWDVLAAVNRIETDHGRNMGPSSAGAVGWMQFMPDTWLRWGMDASGDGIADPWDPEDGVFAAARYLAAAGAATDLARAVFAYNHAQWYVDDVLELARVYAAGGGDAGEALSLDRLDVDLEAARREVALAGRRLRAARDAAGRLAGLEDGAAAFVADAELLSDRIERQRALTLAGVRRVAADGHVASLETALADAEDALRTATDAASGAAFALAGMGVLASPAYDGGYVFPVGGGPSLVSVSRDHHDYPAADIVAPAGSPVYAHADAVVASLVDGGRCGVGATLETADGLSWTYCHLSYRDPSVQAGTVLAAGAPLGLVGSTGRSTGPHLHLQLRPATAYPQAQEWFAAFAGRAFRWQDEVAVVAPAGNVFAVVPDAGVVLFSR